MVMAEDDSLTLKPTLRWRCSWGGTYSTMARKLQ